MILQDLSAAKWTVRPVGDLGAIPRAMRIGEIPATVPGCIHTDLMRAGVIPDPRIGFNEREVQWVGETDWEYRAEFEVMGEVLAHERIDLVSEGLDTIAEVSLNGRTVGGAANMFHPHRFDLRGAIREGGNELSMVFRSPLRHIRTEEARLGKRPVNGDWDPYIFIRKAACNFGWDWAPKVATCGVCGAIRLEGWSEVRVAAVRPLVTRVASTPRWKVDVHVELEWSGATVREPAFRVVAMLPDFDELTSTWVVHDTPASGQERLCLSGEIENPAVWNPRQPGGPDEQPWRVLLVDACRKDKDSLETIDSHRMGIAFREVRLNTDPDEHGEKFQIEVNGKPIFCKGANWIPEGLFPDDRSPEKIRQRVRQAADANMNMLRVWGGGMYECDAFYEECDRLGIMVWQDFMFACACYPEEAPYPALVEAEARHQIARLSSHPSVVLWCGGNECVWGYESWGHAATDTEGPWKKRVGDKTWGAGYYFDLLPRLVRELDPTRPYWANSPFAGRTRENPNQETRGDRHTWDASPASEAFRTIIPRFCAEFGRQAPPSLDALARVMKPDELAIGSSEMEHRQRGTGGMAAHIDTALAEHFPPAKDFAEWHRNAQELQARALRAAIEWLAANRPRCMGALIWQLNDAWPGMSWSLIDSDGVPKPAYEAVREAFGKIQP